MTVPEDYDRDPQRYRTGVATTRAHTGADLYARVAALLAERRVATVVDVGCAEGVLRAAIGGGRTRVVGLDRSPTMLAAHPSPVVCGDARRLPFRDGVADAVTALNVLYHLADPVPALREAARVLRQGGSLVVSTIARDDSPELARFWRRPATSFDTEDAPELLGGVFGAVRVWPWDAPLVTLPTADAVRDYLRTRHASPDVVEAAATELAVPLTVTKRGSLIEARHPAGPGRPPG